MVGAGLAGAVALLTGHRFSGGRANSLKVELAAAELEARRARWAPPPPKARYGALAKYVRCVHPASDGCVTDG